MADGQLADGVLVEEVELLDPLKMRFHAGMMGNLVEHNATQCGDKLGQRSVRKFDEKMLGEGWQSIPFFFVESEENRVQWLHFIFDISGHQLCALASECQVLLEQQFVGPKLFEKGDPGSFLAIPLEEGQSGEVFAKEADKTVKKGLFDLRKLEIQALQEGGPKCGNLFERDQLPGQQRFN